MKLAAYVLIAVFSYCLMVGDLQQDENRDCALTDFVGQPFDVLWPTFAVVPIAGQLYSIGWAVGERVSYGYWPKLQLRTSKLEAQIACGQLPTK